MQFQKEFRAPMRIVSSSGTLALGMVCDYV